MGRIVGLPRGGCWVCFCLLGSVGCGEDISSGRVPSTTSADVVPLQTSTSLVSHAQWRLVPLDQDPYWVGADEAVPCQAEDIEATDDSIEVNTRYCNHATLMQPSLQAVAAGESLHQELWWQPLVSETAAIAHLRLRLGDVELLRRELQVPGPADVLHHHSLLSAAAPAGTPVYFHVSNHGTNSYTLHLLELERPSNPITTEP